MKIKNIKSSNPLIYLLSFAIPAFFILIVFIFAKVTPFGNNTLLISDMNQQYIDYFAYFKSIFSGNNDFFYSLTKGLGGDMLGLSAYYLLSPLNIILLFFSNETLPNAITLITLIKLGLCGLTFGIYINKTFKIGLSSIIFTSAYALMAYNIVYMFNIMWLDGVILLPLIALGIDRIIDKKRPLLYVICLFAAITINFYVGFMLCLFSVIYFLYKIFRKIDKISSIKNEIRLIITYACSSVIAAGMSLFILLPAVKSMDGVKPAFDMDSLYFIENFDFINIFTKFFTCSFNENQLINGLPNIFCGALIVLMLILFFLNTKIKTKEKLLSLSVLAILMISFHINTLNMVWQAFYFPTWFPYRYSFIFSFFVIIFALRCFETLKKGITAKELIVAILIFIVTSTIVFSKKYDFINMRFVYMDAFIIIFSAFILFMIIKKPKTRKILISMLILIQLFNLTLNSYVSLRIIQEFSHSDMSTYKDSLKETQNIISKIKKNDAGLYRIEKTFQRSLNDSMQFDYNGLSHFSSCEKLATRNFLRNMGFTKSDKWACYSEGSTLTASSILGQKYLITNSNNNTNIFKDKFIKYYLDSSGSSQNPNINVFENKYALPLMFSVDSSIINFKENIGQRNIFKYQNDILKTMIKNKLPPVFYEANLVNVTYNNVSVSKDSETLFKRIGNKKDAYIEYTIRIASPNTLYAFIDAPDSVGYDTEIFINNKSLGRYFDMKRWNAVALGNFITQSKNTYELIFKDVKFKLKMNEDEINIRPYFYHENVDVLKKYYNVLSSDKCKLSEVTSSHFKGTVNIANDNKYLLFTIPYDEGWAVSIDNKPVSTNNVFNALMAVKVPFGIHEIDLKYTPRGLYFGIVISIISFMILLLYIFINRKNIKTKKTKTKKQ